MHASESRAPIASARGHGRRERPTQRVRSLGELGWALGLPQGQRLLGLWLAQRWDALRLALRLRRCSAGERELLRREHERRSARRVAATLGALKGAFAKAGQFGAIRHDLLGAEWTEPLAGLRDRVPPLPLARIRSVVEAELGAPLERLFHGFEPQPLAAASMAQVHRARLPGGEQVAVKVQYPWLHASLPADLVWLRALLGRVARGRLGASARQRLFEEFAAGLREELDFEREARVAAEIAANLAEDPQVRVPEIVASHSSARVLTMRYRPAVAIGDRAGLARLGVEPAALLRILVRAYAKQIFVDGLFHADPHPGNLLVLDEAGARDRPRLLFVDFGLSRRLDPELRRGLRRGMHALLKRDAEDFVGAMRELRMVDPSAEPGVRRAVETMLAETGGAAALGLSGAQVLALKDRAKALLQETPGLQLPNDLLLYAKTLTTVFALGAELAPEVDLMQLSLPYLLRFLGEREEARPA